MLLPECAQWIPRATVTMITEQLVPLDHQMLCNLYIVVRLCAVEQLSVLWTGPEAHQSRIVHYSLSVFLTTLVDVMTRHGRLAEYLCMG